MFGWHYNKQGKRRRLFYPSTTFLNAVLDWASVFKNVVQDVVPGRVVLSMYDVFKNGVHTYPSTAFLNVVTSPQNACPDFVCMV